MSLKCPVCGTHLDRVHCRTGDRFIGLFVPVRRYRCHNSTCGWETRQIGHSPKRTTSVRNTRFKLSILTIILVTGSGAFITGWFALKPPQAADNGSSGGFPKLTGKDLMELKRKLDK